MVELKCKVVGLSYHKVENPVTSGDTVYLIAESNKYDNDAIEVFNKEEIKLLFKLKKADVKAQNKEFHYLLDEYDKALEYLLSLYK